MAIEVRVPTILRPYTGGQKAVHGSGDTLGELLTDLDSRYPGLRARLVTDEGSLHRFVNVYVNDEDVRFVGALDAKVSDGDTVTVLPAVAGGALAFAAAAALGGAGRRGVAPGGAAPCDAAPRRAARPDTEPAGHPAVVRSAPPATAGPGQHPIGLLG